MRSSLRGLRPIRELMSEVISIHAARSASSAARSSAAAPTSGDGKSFSAALTDASKRPKGEKTEKVDGRHYEKIVAGPDKGRYLNRTGNTRDGEDFRIVQRGGRTFHVYDVSHDHQVFELPHDPKSVTVKASESGGSPAA
jgi:hypothetical protein